MSSQLPNPLEGANQTHIEVLQSKLLGACFELFKDDAICPQIKQIWFRSSSDSQETS